MAQLGQWSWWTSFIGKYVLTLFTTTHITRMKQLFQWTCSLVDNVPFAPFGSCEFISSCVIFFALPTFPTHCFHECPVDIWPHHSRYVTLPVTQCTRGNTITFSVNCSHPVSLTWVCSLA